MKLKTKYFVNIAAIHTIFLAITLIIYSHNKVLFVFCEATLLLSLIFFIGFYNTTFRSFRLLHSGLELINDKDFNLKYLPLGEPELDRLIVVFNKMIDQLRLERTKTTEKNFFLEKLIEASPAAIIIMGKNNNIQTVNPAALTLLNIDDITNLPESVSDLPSPWNTELSKLNETDTLIIHLNGINQFKCYKSNFIDRGVKQAFFIIEGLTKELLNAERQSYEKIIKMMSHEVNNSVGAVNSIIDSTIHYMEIQKDTDYKDYISVLNVASERNNNLNLFTNRFAEIVRIPPPVISKCDLKEVVNQVLILFQPEFEKKGIRTKTQYHSDQTLIAFDYQQLELVLINIIKNAVQAIQVNGEITLIFKTQPSSLIVENTGEPIPETVQKRLFESFFTTKKEGQGIGLTLIREILTNHRYDFSLKTRGDGITEFQIVFN